MEDKKDRTLPYTPPGDSAGAPGPAKDTPPLSTLPRQIGPYRIEGLVGRGGMGVVYQAEDTKLGRRVALKVLHADVLADAERVARFDREARVLAALNHPNIAAIHGVEESQGSRILVLELVPGRNLAELLATGPLVLDQALRIACEIAGGLEAAHEKGVIHRDLKPGNVMVTPEGRVKLLDFGLAKHVKVEQTGSDGESTPRIASDSTVPGAILGTVAYMSPEQARGKPLDRRTDIWAFGCCLYEALTGRRAFAGDTASDTLAGIIRGEPDWSAIPDTTPSAVRTLLRRCLEKELDRRLRDIGDARLLLEDSIENAERPEGPAPAKAAPRRTGLFLGVLLGAAAVAAIAVGLWGLLPHPSPPTGTHAVTRLIFKLPDAEPLAFARLTPLAVGQPSIALSPDGSLLAYVARRGDMPLLYLREMSKFEGEAIPGTEGAFGPFFSPDGRWIGFFTEKGLSKVSVSGGPPVLLCEAPNPVGATWCPDGAILFTTSFGLRLYSLPPTGGSPELLISKAAPGTADLTRCNWPSLLPGNRGILCCMSRISDFLQVLALDTLEKKVVREERGSCPHYVRTGHIVFARDDTLCAAPFDLVHLKLTAPALPVLSGMRRESEGAAQYAISRDGTLAYVPGGAMYQGTLVWIDRKSGAEKIAWPGIRRYGSFKLSPDGSGVAVGIADPARHIWICDFDRNLSTRFTFEGENGGPVWTPDRSRIAYYSETGGARSLYVKPADGSGKAEPLLLPSEGYTYLWDQAWSRDGRILLFQNVDPESDDDIWSFDLETRATRPFLKTPASEAFPAFSADSRWVAYTSDESGRSEVYVRSYPSGGEKRQVSTDGGEEPIWVEGEIFYRAGDRWMVLAVSTEPGFSAGQPRLIFQGPYLNIPGRSYDYDPRGDRFLVVKGRDDVTSGTEIRIILNWFEELSRLVPVPDKS